MSSAIFLLVVVGLSVLGSLVVWLRHRQRPRSVESGIDAFSREMRALAPDDHRRDDVRRRPSPGV